MVNSDLVRWIIDREKEGHTQSQISMYLLKQGYKQQDVNVAFNYLNATRKKRNIKLIVLINLIVLLIVLISSIVFYYVTRTECGNGVLERDETPATCCVDAGCLGEQSCTENKCIEPTCGACQYLENHVCKDHTCCSDNDCNDNNPNTHDVCEEPSRRTSKCTYTAVFELKDDESSVSIDIAETVSFIFEGQTHSITLEEINDGSATVLIQSTPQKFILKAGETRTLDLTGNGLHDISVTVTSFGINSIQLKVRKVEYACLTNAHCDDDNPDTEDVCNNPRTIDAYCSNTDLNECESDSDCNDNDATTKDTCSGSPTKCVNELITSCLSGDGFCPEGCNFAFDDDCEIKELECGDVSWSNSTQDVDNFDCFIDAAEICNPARLFSTFELELLGLVTNTETRMEIKGLDENKCTYFQKTKDIKVSFSYIYEQELLALNFTQEEINDLEAEANQNAQIAVGERRTCKFEKTDLVDVLENWKAGSYSSDDFDLAECE